VSRIYLSPPDVGELEERFVLEALRSGWVAPLGPQVDAFEEELAARVSARHAVALSSGTSALHLALVSWGVGSGDFVPTSTLTFVATANAIAYTGATPVFIDVVESTGNIDPDLLDRALTELHDEGVRVPAVLPVDLLGKCADYTRVGDVAKRHGVRILSDAAESLGASHEGIPAGRWGDAAVLSFNGNKIITTSGGGMLLTDDEVLANRVRFLSTQAREPAVHYQHRELGYNYRLSNLLAALGRAQLQRLNDMMARRREIRRRYQELISRVAGVSVFGARGDDDDNCWLTALIVDHRQTGWAASDMVAYLTELDIEARPLWKPMHLQPLYANAPRYLTGAAERLYNNGVTLPSGSALSDGDVTRVIEALDRFLAGAR
jgi:dTDP-4-amino-4,6-dideoxygalactose transaminase